MTRTTDIERLLRSGRRLPGTMLDARQAESSLGHVRVAIVVPRYGFSAVRRNRLKRRLRELLRHIVLPLSCSCDVLVRARREAYAAPFAALRAEVERLARQVRT